MLEVYVIMAGAAISWKSKRQTMVASSTAESETLAASTAAKEAIGLRNLASKLCINQGKSTVLHKDNQPCINMQNNHQLEPLLVGKLWLSKPNVAEMGPNLSTETYKPRTPPTPAHHDLSTPDYAPWPGFWGSSRDFPDQDSQAPPASDQGSPTPQTGDHSDPDLPISRADLAISTPCPSPRPEFPDDMDAALHLPPPIAYLASGATALLKTLPVDPTELIAPARDPPHWRAAMATPQADEWRLATQAEFDLLSREFLTFTPIDESLVPADSKVLGSRFVFCTKRDQHSQIKSHKGRLVACGDSQRSGIDFDETFAPVAKFTSICALLALAAPHAYHIHQANVNKAYLHSKLDTPLYICVPKGIYMPGKVLQLHRSLYGLRQAGRIWNNKIDSALLALGYVATESDHCVYVWTAGDERHYIALYVDDLLMISPSLPEIERTLQGLEQRYGVKQLGEAEYVLGIQIWRSAEVDWTERGEAIDGDCVRASSLVQSA
ncbi:BQ5605_C044g12147 [Microbotryum silenes-dioicae]|uniref:BQ5605_C044g12147 protein n=1 Tax=Microbotryum silenes-dioicae TaxID=796604 RepID=A0A2X0MQ37_9BASI|nr:BQ5605_C044g12147 [Microbotryum silenes-dioicae]